MTRARRRLTLGMPALLLLFGCAVPPGVAGPAPQHASGNHAARDRTRQATDPASGRTGDGTALRQLGELEVKGRAPLTGYARDRFGAAWLDTDRNGCDTRNDILGRDLTHRAYEPDTHGCVVVSGILEDPYTRTRIRFVKGNGDLVDIDHVVALGNAWVTGAFKWEIRRRAALANDPMNLLAVDAPANRQKGDGDAATWLPSNKGFRCAYVARQVGVKAKYGLWVTPAERDAMARVLASCPSQPTVPDSGAPVVAPLRLSGPSGRPSVGSAEGTASGFRSCDEARAAGAAPVHRGEPGYNPRLDGDGDGVACE